MEITRRCAGCGEALPLSSYSLNQHGNPRSHCRPCRSTVEKARYAARVAGRPAWHRAHVERQQREREARATAKQYRRTQREAERALREGQRAETETRRRVRREAVAMHTAERIAHLTGLLTGTPSNERISSQDGWDAAMAELTRLWRHSGDRECVACGRTVSPAHMRPPGPANFYTGKCNPCAREEREESVRRVYGPPIGPLRGPRRIPQRGGGSISLGELARRHREPLGERARPLMGH